MSEEEISEVSTSVRWLLVGFVLALLLAIGLVALLYQPRPAESICSNTEANTNDEAASVDPNFGTSKPKCLTEAEPETISRT